VAVFGHELYQGSCGWLKKTAKNPTDRGKLGSKRSILTEAKGIPISIVLAPANIRDYKLMKITFDSIAIKRPSPRRMRQNLLADKDYSNKESRTMAQKYGYEVHIPQKKNEKIKIPRRPGRRKARRWVVEQTFGCLNRNREILIRWQKEPGNYEAMLHIAAAITCFKRSVHPQK
jgi:putative transposase